MRPLLSCAECWYRCRVTFFTRSGKLIREVTERADTSLRKARIALLSPTTTNLLVPVLRALCFRDRIQAEFHEGLYGSIDQEILDSSSGLSRFRPDVVFLMTHWRSLKLPPATTLQASFRLSF
jgi:predicted enzyme involved in methoxymalonyl-ACP biosynthesis